MQQFVREYNCCVIYEPTSNISCDYSLNGYSLLELLSSTEYQKLCPDLIITFGGNWVSYVHDRIVKFHDNFEHWSTREDAMIVDCFRSETVLLHMNANAFFEYCAMNVSGQRKNNGQYFEEWKKKKDSVSIGNIPFSNFYIAGELVKTLPKDSIYHTGILNSTRDSFYFDIDRSIYSHSNIGTDGIDGSISTFLGSSMLTDRQCFLLIGDLSFFYDMNSLGIRGLKNNIHILVVNNHAGGEFHLNIGLKKNPMLNVHTSAAHDHSVKGWVDSLGFEYLRADDKVSFDKNLPIFISDKHDTPVIFEVFTDADKDGEIGRSVMESYRNTLNNSLEDQAKKKIRQILGGDNVQKIRGILKM